MMDIIVMRMVEESNHKKKMEENLGAK